jgi:signal transduction histidine kinase
MQAVADGVDTLGLARIHELALVPLLLPDYSPERRATMVRRAGAFFAEALIPIEKTHRAARQVNVHLKQLYEALRVRSLELTTSNRQLKSEITQRKAVENSLRKSEQHYGQLLEQSAAMQEQLRLLSRQLLLAQEEERKKISRELHDVIAQTLTGINIRLSALKKEAALNTKGLHRSITRTQKLVEHSVSVVHRFARELRPAVLDDLGLIPALHSFMKSFHQQTGIRVSLSAFAEIEKLHGDKRTALYRVAQEALTNIARHARASEALVKISKLDGAVCMKVKDNGRGFQQHRILRGKRSERLGLLGMRERLQMVGGNFSVSSAPGKGTTIVGRIPLSDGHRGQNRTHRVTHK